MRLLDTIGGWFILNQEGSMISFCPFEKESEIIAQELTSPSEQIIKSLTDNIIAFEINQLTVSSPQLYDNLKPNLSISLSLDPLDAVLVSSRAHVETWLVEQGFFSSVIEKRSYAREVASILSKKKIQLASEKRDKHVAQGVVMIDELDKAISALINHLREWYSLHFPELNTSIENQLTYSRLITFIGDRSNFNSAGLARFKLHESKEQELISLAANSIGGSLEPQDSMIVQQIAKSLLDLMERRHQVEKWIIETTKNIAPNLSVVATPIVAARLITLAGGQMELALITSSKLQLLGAEKALFRSIKSGALLPKHGVIFQTPALNSAPWFQRGRLARAIAGKCSIAARVDAFSGRYIADELQSELEVKLEEIRKALPAPPKGKKQNLFPDKPWETDSKSRDKQRRPSGKKKRRRRPPKHDKRRKK
ncbi:MAG: C/D box methylation guide ribonucleoprotein complex aNOP56 subunit [Candidatus Kariarchaeaceae archaeon]